MLQKCMKTAKYLTFFAVIAVYLTLELLFVTREDKSELATTPRTLVAYSWEYKLQEDSKPEGLDCPGSVPEAGSSNWQRDDVLDAYFLSAFYDLRQEPYRYVRAVGLAPRNSSLYCQIWYPKNGTWRSVTRKARISYIWSPEWGRSSPSGDVCERLVPSLVSCSVPSGIDPAKVSFVDGNCSGGRAVLDVVNPPKSNMRFVVCVKPLHFSDYNSASLTEWIQLNKLFGADRIFIYGATPVDGYDAAVRHVPFEPPTSCSDNQLWWKRKLEIVTYNDCFYRNAHSTKFVVPLDVDEIILPKISDTWSDVFRLAVDDSDVDEYSSFSVRNVYFFRKYPPQAVRKFRNAVRHVRPNASIFERSVRSVRFSPESDSSKSFVNVDKTLTVFNHYSYHVLGHPRRRFVFPERVIQLSHYRSSCDPKLIDGCHNFLNDLTYDDSLDKFRRRIESNGYRST